MAEKVRIVFRGEIIAGEKAVVREQAAQLLKATPEQIERIFSGKPIVRVGWGERSEPQRHCISP